MDCICICPDGSFTNASADFASMESFLVLATKNRVDWVISRVRVTGKEQHFISLTVNDRPIAGHYDAAIIDGADDTFNAKLLYDEVYPYLGRNVKAFYILTE